MKSLRAVWLYSPIARNALPAACYFSPQCQFMDSESFVSHDDFHLCFYVTLPISGDLWQYVLDNVLHNFVVFCGKIVPFSCLYILPNTFLWCSPVLVLEEKMLTAPYAPALCQSRFVDFCHTLSQPALFQANKLCVSIHLLKALSHLPCPLLDWLFNYTLPLLSQFLCAMKQEFLFVNFINFCWFWLVLFIVISIYLVRQRSVIITLFYLGFKSQPPWCIPNSLRRYEQPHFWQCLPTGRCIIM